MRNTANTAKKASATIDKRCYSCASCIHSLNVLEDAIHSATIQDQSLKKRDLLAANVANAYILLIDALVHDIYKRPMSLKSL